MRRLLVLLATPCTLLLAGCTLATPAPSPAPSASPSADACASSPGPELDLPMAVLTPADLCADDGDAWQWGALLGWNWHASSAYRSDDAACAAAGATVQSVRQELDGRFRGLAPSSAGLAGERISVAVLEQPVLAETTLAALESLRDACAGTTTELPQGLEERMEALEVGAWHGIAHRDPLPTDPIEIETYWTELDGVVAVVQLDAALGLQVRERILELQRDRLETPADAVAAPADCAASADDAGLGASDAEVTAADLCAIDERPWLLGIGRFQLLDAAPSDADACAAFDWGPGIALDGIQAASVRVAGTDGFDAEAIVFTTDDPAAASETAAGLERFASACTGASTGDGLVVDRMLPHDDADWSSIALERTPAEPGMLDPADVVLRWTVVGGVLAVVETGEGMAAGDVELLLDTQLDRLR